MLITAIVLCYTYARNRKFFGHGIWIWGALLIVCLSRSRLYSLGLRKLTFTESFPKLPVLWIAVGLSQWESPAGDWREERIGRYLPIPGCDLTVVVFLSCGSKFLLAMAVARFWRSQSLFLPLLARWLMASHCCYPWMLHHPLLVLWLCPHFWK